MPIIIQDGKFLELRNSDDSALLPAMEIKSGEDMREAAKRAADQFFGLVVPDEAIHEGFQARVGTEVVSLYPVDASKMDMSLLRPAEEAATWAWKNVPESMGHVVALGFPRNLGERRNGLVTKVESFAPAAPGFPASQNPAQLPGGEAGAVFSALQASVAAKTASLRNVAPHELAARTAELEQEREDLRLMAEDLGIDMPAIRMNASDEPNGLVTARALIKQNDGTIITARQKDGRSLLPGGHLENGETPEDAVARELQEEMGLDIRQALTGETYDFEGEGLHRVFVVDGSKLDLSKLQPGDDVEEAEIQNSPFTDSHGVQHPGGERDNTERIHKVLSDTRVICPRTGKESEATLSEGKDAQGRKQVVCHDCGNLVNLKQNDAGADAGQAAALAEGVEHVAEDIQEGLEASPKRDAELMHGLAEGIEHESREISGERKNSESWSRCLQCGYEGPKGDWSGQGRCPSCSGSRSESMNPPRENAAHSDERPLGAYIKGSACATPGCNGGIVKWCNTCHQGFCSKCLCKEHQNDADSGSHGHEYPGKMDGPFPVVRCNGSDTIATQETVTDWRCENCGEVISGPPKAAQVLDA
jgi:ADP-ribose pyrophosphatase YjhB (NUDIX family)